MSDITVTAALVGLADPVKAEVKSYVAGAAITKGQAVALTTAGLVVAADATVGGAHLLQFRGIALNGGGAGQAIDVLHDGECYGFSVSALNVGAILYLSTAAGAIADAAAGGSDITVRVGRVSILSDAPTYTKVARIFVDWAAADWA